MPYSKRYANGKRYPRYKARNRRTSRKFLSKYSKMNQAYDRRINNNPIVRVPGRFFMPSRMITQFTYVKPYQLTSVIGSSPRQVMRGNGPFDPDQSGTGNQPNGFDQLMGTLYVKYGVISSKIRITCIPATTPWKVSVFPYYQSGATNVDYENTLLMPGAKGMITTAASAGGSVKVLTSYAKSKNMIGCDPYSDEQACGSNTTNPAIQWYWQISGRPIDETSSDTCFIEVEITYYCILSQQTLISQS